MTAVADRIAEAVDAVVSEEWNARDGTVVPATEDVALKNGAVRLDAVYLYVDMADSTRLARDIHPGITAKVIRSFLDACCRVIKSQGGEIRSFDGDRVMAIFVGNSKNSSAAETALRINGAVTNIVRPAVYGQFQILQEKGWHLRHCTGVASGQALVVRGGVRGTNDLVSVGRAPNIAAKLSDFRYHPNVSYITADVHGRLNKSAKFATGKRAGEHMWESRPSAKIDKTTVPCYRSSWRRTP